MKIWYNIQPVNNDNEEDEDVEIEEFAARKEANFFEQLRVIPGQLEWVRSGWEVTKDKKLQSYGKHD